MTTGHILKNKKKYWTLWETFFKFFFFSSIISYTHTNELQRIIFNLNPLNGLGMFYTLHFFPKERPKRGKKRPFKWGSWVIHHLCSASNPNYLIPKGPLILPKGQTFCGSSIETDPLGNKGNSRIKKYFHGGEVINNSKGISLGSKFNQLYKEDDQHCMLSKIFVTVLTIN